MAFLKTLVLLQQQLLLRPCSAAVATRQRDVNGRMETANRKTNPKNGIEPSNLGQILRELTLRIPLQVVKGGIIIPLAGKSTFLYIIHLLGNL